MALPSKRKGLPRRKFADGRKHKSRSISPTIQGASGGSGSNGGASAGSSAGCYRHNRFLDPTLLSRGMSARVLGAGLSLAILPSESVERDLRHMEAYANACTTYHQQYFQHVNKALVSSGHFGNAAAAAAQTTSSRVLPIRIDPEEEKRVALLRKRIARAESTREVLETEYMSIRAHYVHASHELKRLRHALDSQTQMLQTLVKGRGKVVALLRARCQIVRDIYKALVKRTLAFEKLSPPVGRDQDLVEVWNSLEQEMKEAEKSLLQLDLSLPGAKQRKKKRSSPDDEFEPPVLTLEARELPETPTDVPILLSQMSEVPDRAAAFATASIFGSKEHSMTYITTSLPKTLEDFEDEKEDLRKVTAEADKLQAELENERKANKELQGKIVGTRKRSDELCSMMVMLRGETEAVLQRHNILLDTPLAREVALDATKESTATPMTSKTTKSVPITSSDAGELVNEDSGAPAKGKNGANTTPVISRDDDNVNNFGDDEGGDDEEESTEAPPSEVILEKNGGDDGDTIEI